MSEAPDNPFDGLVRLFHEPKRLAIVTALADAENGLSFSELREIGDLTDGNLNRHLKALQDGGVIVSKREPASGRPRTRVELTDSGRDAFVDYLRNLETVLQTAVRRIDAGERQAGRRAPFGISPA